MFADVGTEKTKQWLDLSMLGFLNKFFQLCNMPDFLKDFELSCFGHLNKDLCWLQFCNIYVLFLQDQKPVQAVVWRTNTGDVFVFGPRSDKKE